MFKHTFLFAIGILIVYNIFKKKDVYEKSKKRIKKNKNVE